MRNLLLDTSYIVPLFRKNDSLRQNALDNKNLLNERCYVSNLVIQEVVTILAMRTNDIDIVKNAYDFIRDQFYIIDECVLDNFDEKVMDVFYNVNHKKYNLSFVDSSLVVLANLFNLELVSFDGGFKEVNELKMAF